MTKYMRYICASVAVATIMSACSKDKSDTLAQDSTLSSDLQMASGDTAQAQLNDVPPAAAPAPAPAASAPRPRPTPRPTTSSNNAAPAKRVGTIPSGTALALTSNSRICTNTHKVGQTVSATLSQAVSGSNGAVIPAGATVSLEITQLKRSENVKDDIQMAFVARSVSFGGNTYSIGGPVSIASIEKVKNQPKSKDAQKVATGAAVGAIVGQVLGKNTKSTVIGGAIGAAAGAGAAATTANTEGCVADGGSLSVTLNGPVEVNI